MIILTRSTLQRAAQVRLLQVAAGLALTITLSLAPLVAVSFALLKRVPALRPLERAIEQHLLQSLLPAEISRAVLKALQQFASNASGLTLVGALLVLAAAVMLLLTLENALNQMWGVKTPRPLLRRTGLVVLLLAVGPLLVGAGLWASASLIGASMGLVRHTPPWLAFGLELGPVVLCSAALAITLRVLPHAPVRWRHAVVAGVLGGIALELGKRAFAAYLIHGPIYQSLYGALATLPVFLLWVYFSMRRRAQRGVGGGTAGSGRGCAQPGRSRWRRSEAGARGGPRPTGCSMSVSWLKTTP